MGDLSTVRARLDLSSSTPVPVGATVYLTLDVVDFEGADQVPRRYTTTVGTNGTATLDVWPNELGSRGSGYDIVVIYERRTILKERAVLPAASTPVDLAHYFTAPRYATRPSLDQLVIEAGSAAQQVLAAYADAEALSRARQSADASAGVAQQASAAASASSKSAGSSAESAATSAENAIASAAVAKRSNTTAQQAADIATDSAMRANAAAAATIYYISDDDTSARIGVAPQLVLGESDTPYEAVSLSIGA